MVDKDFITERMDNLFNELSLLDDKIGIILTPEDMEKLLNDEAVMVEWKNQNIQICLCEW